MNKEKENWHDELFELSEKYCKHDDSVLNSCLFYIFKPFIEKIIQQQKEKDIAVLEGMKRHPDSPFYENAEYYKSLAVDYNIVLDQVIKKIKEEE